MRYVSMGAAVLSIFVTLSGGAAFGQTISSMSTPTSTSSISRDVATLSAVPTSDQSISGTVAVAGTPVSGVTIPRYVAPTRSCLSPTSVSATSLSTTTMDPRSLSAFSPTIASSSSDRLSVRSCFGPSDPGSSDTFDEAYWEDSFSGGFSFALTERLDLSVDAELMLRTDTNHNELLDLTGNSGALGATYTLLPGVETGVRYSYGSHETDKDLRENESSVSFSLLARF